MSEVQTIQSWVKENKPRNEMVYYDEYMKQIDFIKGDLPIIFRNDNLEGEAVSDLTVVISDHTSKSIKLPVIQLALPEGIVITMRGNFHNWMVSISSPIEASRILCDTLELFDPSPDEDIISCYCEGFPKELVYKSFDKNPKQFTIELPYNLHFLYMFLWSFIFIMRKELP